VSQKEAHQLAEQYHELYPLLSNQYPSNSPKVSDLYSR